VAGIARLKTELTPQQIAGYRERGFLVIPDFLTSDELEQWRSAVDEAVAAFNNPAADSADYYSQVFIQRINLWKTSPAIKKLVLDPRIGEMCCDLEGIDAIRVWHDQALIKRPWDNPTSWHLDNPYWSFDSRHSISIWVALDDATYQNGCLYFLPGTHKTARFDNAGIGPNMNELFKVYPEWATIPSVAAPMRAGSCSFHNGLTAHAAGANMTPGWRRAMTCAFMPDGATFNGKQNILSRAQMAQLQIGDPIRFEDHNLLVYARQPQLVEA
jgi:ectoine hydroxylase-related dioxygenase (phytanoyl-CoA dioxygenase family)